MKCAHVSSIIMVHQCLKQQSHFHCMDVRLHEELHFSIFRVMNQKSYKFGGQVWKSVPAPHQVQMVFDKYVKTEAPINVALLQEYNKGGSIAFHSDDEQVMMRKNGCVHDIFSFSFGCPCDFRFKPTGENGKNKKRKRSHNSINNSYMTLVVIFRDVHGCTTVATIVGTNLKSGLYF